MGATKRDESLHDLTAAQLAAIQVLMAGGTHEEAARAAGVHRVTVTRWANHHPAFITALNRAQADLVHGMRSKVFELTEGALDVVGTAIEAGDVETALRWLRLMPPALEESTSDPTEPAEVVERVRKRMPTALDKLLVTGDEPTTEDAERLITERLAG
jgi:hypothetical protein